MFSSRLAWDLHPNPLSILLAGKRRDGTRVLDLTESNPTRAALSYPSREILNALAGLRSLLYDPAPAGLWEARELIAASRGVAVDRVMLTASTSEAYAWLFKLLANPGDQILAPRPSYPLFEFLAALESVEMRHYPLVYHEGWFIDFDELKRALTVRTRAIVVVNPNNPTGSYLKCEELRQLLELCGERGLAIISDEVFADYALTEDRQRVTTLDHSADVLTFRLSGLSKVVGLPQMKLGWILIGGPAALREQAAERLELIADTYLSVGTPVQHALPALLASKDGFQRQVMERLQTNLKFLRAAVAGSAIQVLQAEGGWCVILRVPRIRTEEEWVTGLLERENVLVQPGYFYDFDSEAFLALSLLTPQEIFAEGVRGIQAFAR
ncbi:MAG: pyridoxal phosphate-dependent aminotransferase [Acidobacteriota bacterium]|nr:pyridoxal phosphate-dependent aminotransferase [Acidobacteriota bacterium]